MKHFFFIAFIFFSLFASAQSTIRQGIWHAEFKLNDTTTLPFQFEVKGTLIEVMNAEERITVTEIKTSGDSVFIQMPVFDTEIRCRIENDSLKGKFLNHTRLSNNIIPFKAAYGKYVPLVNSFDLKNFEGRWEATFAGDEPPLNKAVGIFKQTGNHVTGTFLTPTGDYRYLEGYADGNKMYLSCFDGSHLFYFPVMMHEDGTLSGDFYSGSHSHDTWSAKRNDKAELPDPDSLTFVKKGHDHLNFSLPDADSNIVSITDAKFQNKVVVVQVMGTWCPNCMDETAFLAPFYKRYHDKGFEVIGLDYERITNMPFVKKNLNRLKKQYDIQYSLLFAGSTDKVNRAYTLPQLTSIISFPTSIIIDKKGRVRKIHTGFSGPATGQDYEKWKDDFEKFIQKLLKLQKQKMRL